MTSTTVPMTTGNIVVVRMLVIVVGRPVHSSKIFLLKLFGIENVVIIRHTMRIDFSATIVYCELLLLSVVPPSEETPRGSLLQIVQIYLCII